MTPDSSIRASLNNTIDAWNEKDVARFISGFTPKGLMNEFDASSVAAQFLPEFIGDPPITLGGLSNVQVLSSTSVRAIVDLNIGIMRERHDYVFALFDGAWKIDGGPIISSPVPSGVTTVPVQLREFAFVFDKNAAGSGNIAFTGTNVGTQPHEIALAKIPANADLQELLRTEEDVPGFEFIGSVFLEQGESMNMIFTRALAAGRYSMVCFVPDEATGTPHAFLGMTAEFTVGAGSGSGLVRPPSTGDGGLIGDSNANGLAAVSALVVLAGLAALSFARRRI